MDTRKPKGLRKTCLETKYDVVEEIKDVEEEAMTPFEQLKSLYMHAITSLDEEDTQGSIQLFTGTIHECDALLKESDADDVPLVAEFHYIYAMSLTHLAHLSRSFEEEMEDVEEDEEELEDKEELAVIKEDEEEISREDDVKEASAVQHTAEETHAFLSEALTRIAKGIQADKLSIEKWENAAVHFNVALTMAYARRACLGMKGEEVDVQFACLTFDKVVNAFGKDCNDADQDLESTLLPLLAIFNVFLDCSGKTKAKIMLWRWMEKHYLELSAVNAFGCCLGRGNALLTVGQGYCEYMEEENTKAISVVEKMEGETCGQVAEKILRACVECFEDIVKMSVEESGEDTVEVRRFRCSVGEAKINLGNCLEIQGKDGEQEYTEAVRIFDTVKEAGGDCGVPERFMEMISAFGEEL